MSSVTILLLIVCLIIMLQDLPELSCLPSPAYR